MLDDLIRRLKCWWKVWLTPKEKKDLLFLHERCERLSWEKDDLLARIHRQESNLDKLKEQLADLEAANASLVNRLRDAAVVLAKKEDVLAKIKELVGG